MQDRELYEKLMGIEKPWQVTGSQVDLVALRVDISVGYTLPEALCPECGKTCPIHDKRQERTWRHLDTMQFKTFVKSQIPRIECPEHKVLSIQVPWAEDHSRFTALFERLAIDVLLACSNQTRAKDLLRISWDEVHHIQEKAVKRGLGRREQEIMPYLGVDEKSFLRGHEYATILADIGNTRVLDVVRDRKEESLKELLRVLSQPQKMSVKAVCMDMWEPYANAVKEDLPEAEVVHDKFHISGYLNTAVDKVRRKENRSLMKEGSSLLTKTKYMWLKNPKGWSDDEKARFLGLKTEGLKVARAWAIKETFGEIWSYVYQACAAKFFKRWYFWATHSRLTPMLDTAKTLKRHLKGILAYFHHRITNATSEGINSRIQHLKASARGFRNFDNFRTAILFYCGKLNLYPLKSR
jgi:transposase